MTPDFASAIDPIFLHVADLMDRIHRHQSLSPDAERERIDRCFQDAEAAMNAKQDWLLAKYAIVSWIDEELKQAPWSGSKWWTENSLEFAYFRSNLAAEQFFTRAKEAAQLARRDALEVFYVCVILGFRGFYRFEDRALTADKLREPANLETWVADAARRLKANPGRPRFQESSRPLRGAPPLDGKFRLIATALLGVVLLGFLVVLGYFLFLA